MFDAFYEHICVKAIVALLKLNKQHISNKKSNTSFTRFSIHRITSRGDADTQPLQRPP